LVESLERQLRRPAAHKLNTANAYINVATSRAAEAKRRGVAAYGKGIIPKRGIESIFNCELSSFREKLPPYLKAPLSIASDLHEGLVDDLQKREAIIFCDRLFDADAATGNQIQDISDALPAAVLMTKAMNTNAVLDDLLRQGDIPRLLNEKLKELKTPTRIGAYRLHHLCLLAMCLKHQRSVRSPPTMPRSTAA
jgi:hypothetical protein